MLILSAALVSMYAMFYYLANLLASLTLTYLYFRSHLFPIKMRIWINVYMYCILLNFLPDLFQPSRKVEKWLFIGKTKNDKCSKGIFIENFIDRSKPFLTSSVPNLQVSLVLINLYHFWDELNPDSNVISRLESIINISWHNIRFSHSALTWIIELLPTTMTL